MEARPVPAVDVLLVEDSEDDILITKKALKDVKLLKRLRVVRDGQEALDFLYHQGKYAEERPPTPGLILLDINMPGLDGFHVLERLKADERRRAIPVIILTTSSREEDVVQSYRSGACSYITKPVGFAAFLAAARRFDAYWTAVSRIPGLPDGETA